MRELTRNDFADIFGVDQKSFSSETLKLIESLNFRYRTIQNDELETLLLTILKRIDNDKQIVGAPERKKQWEDGWKENLSAFKESGFSEDALVPKFIRQGQPLRLKQSYIFAEDPNFELNFIRVLRSWFATTFFASIDNIYEFGCGTGFNLLAISDIFPDKNYFGSDFVSSSIDLVNSIGHEKSHNLVGEVFDMKSPNYNYKIGSNSAIFTFGSIEQLSGDIEPMFNYLLDQDAEIFLHIEPVEELYDLNNLSDFLAFKFQSKRKYTSGLLKKLEDLEKQGQIEILKIKRLFFGSLYMEGYNLLVWKKPN